MSCKHIGAADEHVDAAVLHECAALLVNLSQFANQCSIEAVPGLVVLCRNQR